MPVPSTIDDLSTTASSNSPAGGDQRSTADDYLRAHASFIAQLNAGSGSFLQDGTGATTRTVLSKLKDTINVNDFSGVDPTGATSSTAGILSACVAACAANKALKFSGDYKLSTSLALTSSHNGLTWVLDGATISKGGNVDLITLTSCDDFRIDGSGVFDGVMTSYTGRGFLISGTCSRFYVGPGIITKAFDSAHFEVGQNCGQWMKLYCDMFADASQTTPEMFLKSGDPDTGAMQRSIWGTIQGHITLNGAQATRIKCPLVNYVEIDDDCSVTIVSGVSWSNNGNAIPTISGANTIITGCRFSDNVTLGSGMDGAFVGNAQNGGTFTDNTTGGNCIVIHHRLSTEYNLIGKHALSIALAQELALNGWNADAGNADYTYTADSSMNNVLYNTPITADRTVTLSNGTRNGQTVRVTRTSSCTGAFNVILGSTGKNLGTAGSWADLTYTGTGWRVSGGSIAP